MLLIKEVAYDSCHICQTAAYLTGTHQVLIMTKLYREGDVASLYYHILIHNSRKQLANVATRSNQLVLPYPKKPLFGVRTLNNAY